MNILGISAFWIVLLNKDLGSIKSFFFICLLLSKNLKGCGDGKYLDINQNIFQIGCDRCTKAIDLASNKFSRTKEMLICDNLFLPFRYVDTCLVCVFICACFVKNPILVRIYSTLSFRSEWFIILARKQDVCMQ